jgi:hypothetical protein
MANSPSETTPLERVDFFSVESVTLDPSLMLELLNAATRTALAHRNDANEMYVLGQLEATANVIYVLAVSQGYDGLETICQRMAQDALARLLEISPKKRDVTRMNRSPRE